MKRMEDIIQIFRMEELTKDVRIRIMVKLGDAINYKYASNVTEPLVVELILLLDPENEILKQTRYSKHLPKD
tara:strand:+ start:124 stop:339 length:216 start_codon:yes stop_codon:yes gene_type:complete